MADTYWQRQSLETPLFPDVLWSRPQTKKGAGKLLIFGGNSHGFREPSEAYGAAKVAGVGSIRLMLPDSTKKALASVFAEAGFSPSTPSGSFARQGLSELLENASWADGVLLAGDFGKNSETAVLLESFLAKHDGQTTLCGDALDYFLGKNSTLLNRENTLLCLNLAQLQALAKSNRPNPPIKHTMDLQKLVELLHEWSKESRAYFLTFYSDKVVVAVDGQVSTTPAKSDDLNPLAAHTAVWWLQQPQKPFRTLTSALFDYLNIQSGGAGGS